jgi:ABC-type multidrug transport system fused ATPase/permease subunit
MASIDKLGALLDLPIERTDGLLTTSPAVGKSDTGVVFKDVSYAMSDGREVLHNVSLSIPAGEDLALCGESGRGKSLLLDMLFGLREPASGSVTINGIAPSDIRPDVLRRRIALARDVEIFDGTIAENVHLERPDITLADVRAAIELVGLSPLLQKFPSGMETPLTSSGSPMTTSQLRRLMIARAICGQPEIILIDEVLDSLPDDDAENILRQLMQSRDSSTIIIVTHRASLKSIIGTVMNL